MNGKKWIRIAAAVLILFITVILIARACSDTLALRMAGLDTDGSEIYHGFDASDRQIRVIRTATTKEGALTVVMLAKNALGFWTVEGSDTADKTHPNCAALNWFTGGGTVYYNGELSGGTTIHHVYCGNNASKLIRFEDGQLPDNVTVDLDQWAGGGFWVHITYNALPGAADISINVYDALVENGCIPAD